MKKIIIVLVVLIAGVGIYYFSESKDLKNEEITLSVAENVMQENVEQKFENVVQENTIQDVENVENEIKEEQKVVVEDESKVETKLPDIEVQNVAVQEKENSSEVTKSPNVSKVETKKEQTKKGTNTGKNTENNTAKETKQNTKVTSQTEKKETNKEAKATEKPVINVEKKSDSKDNKIDEVKKEQPKKQEEKTKEQKEEIKTIDNANKKTTQTKSIYDYEFDIDAIKNELIRIGKNMGLKHKETDGGKQRTPNNSSWSIPVTASKKLQGKQLERALKDYVSSMPELVEAYGGNKIEDFTIYVESKGNGSYTFYFLY